MLSGWHRISTLIIIMAALLACKSPINNSETHSQDVSPTLPGAETDTDSGTENIPQLPASGSGWIMSGEDAAWPDYIPDDIPPLEGNIRLVMLGEDKIRIFYQDLSKDQLVSYLQLLEANGFRLEYQVYVQEGFPDDSDERLKEGDYDAVNITKGEYHMNISFGEGDIVYDIYTTGFESAAATAVTIAWPGELQGVVPQPERCRLLSINPATPQGYHVTCRPEDEDVAGDYMRALQNAGYMPKESTELPGGSVLNAVYFKGSVEVALNLGLSSAISIIITWVEGETLAWPPQLAGIVPQPENCSIRNILELGEFDYLISCEGANKQAVQGYIDKLATVGFAETSRLEAQSGELVAVSLEKDAIKIQLIIISPLDFSIKINKKQ